MPQTILALLGMMIVMTLSLNVQRQVLNTKRETIANELEVMATGVALQTMETISARAFDEAAADAPNTVHDDSEFEHFPFDGDDEGNNCAVFNPGSSDVCDDVDDFHGMHATIGFETGAGETIPFEVRVEVHYIDADLDEGPSGRTYRKEVTVHVQDAATKQPFLHDPIYLSRVIAYDFNNGGESASEGWD